MTKERYSRYSGQEEFSDNQRRLGRRLYCADGDMFLRKYIDGKPVTSCYLDAKHGNVSKINGQDSSYLWSLHMCNHEFKEIIPHFTIIYYLKPSFDINMYYVIGNNKKATDIIKKFNNGKWKYWFSELEYSKLQHMILDIEIDPLESEKLENTHITYNLPEFI